MNALVVHESMLGNTRTVAQAVAECLAARVTVTTVEVGSAPAALLDDVDLLVVGGPIHAFGMSRPSTRSSAADQAKGSWTPAAGWSSSRWWRSLSGSSKGSTGWSAWTTGSATAAMTPPPRPTG